MQKNRRILITGSKGFVGRHLVRKLKEEGQDIYESSARIEDEDQVKSLPKAEVFIHLAALVGVPISWEKPKDVVEVNINGTLNILDYCRRNNASIIYAGSYFYGNPLYLPTDENHPIILESPYAVSKYSGEQLCFSYAKKYGFNAISLRIFNPYGPGQNEVMVVPHMISEMLENKQITIADGRPKRDFLFIEDLIESYTSALSKIDCLSGIYNVGYGQNWSIEEIAKMLIEIHGEKVEILDHHNQRPNEILETLAGIQKIKSELGWVPKVSIEQGLRKTYDWHVSKERK